MIQGEGILSLLAPYYRAIRGVPSDLGGGQDFSGLLEQLPQLAQQVAGSHGSAAYSTDGNRWEQLAARRAANRYGWGPGDFRYIDWIIGGGGPSDVVAESGWDPNAVNPSSGSYGIPQILPQAHPDALGLGPSQQVNWLLNYIRQRYGTPQEAYQHKSSTGWY